MSQLLSNMHKVLIKCVYTINCIYQQQVGPSIPAFTSSRKLTNAYLKVLKKLCVLCQVPKVYGIIETLYSRYNYHLKFYHYYVNVLWRCVPKTLVDAELVMDMCSLLIEMEWYVRYYKRETMYINRYNWC